MYTDLQSLAPYQSPSDKPQPNSTWTHTFNKPPLYAKYFVKIVFFAFLLHNFAVLVK